MWSCRFVFDNYTWSHDGADYALDDQGYPVPSRIPLTALLRGKDPLSQWSVVGGNRNGKQCADLCDSPPRTTRDDGNPSCQGPIAGDSFPQASESSPRAVVPEYFNEICAERFFVGSWEVNEALPNASGETLFQAWADMFAPHRCVEITMDPPELFGEQ